MMENVGGMASMVGQTVNLDEDIQQARRLLADGRLTRAVFVFLELRREFPGHPALHRMPLSVARAPVGLPEVLDDRGTESITLYCPQVPAARVTGPHRRLRRVVAA
jgi:hypothetical protein